MTKLAPIQFVLAIDSLYDHKCMQAVDNCSQSMTIEKEFNDVVYLLLFYFSPIHWILM